MPTIHFKSSWIELSFCIYNFLQKHILRDIMEYSIITGILYGANTGLFVFDSLSFVYIHSRAASLPLRRMYTGGLFTLRTQREQR